MTDRYLNFSELEASEEEDRDYRIVYFPGKYPVLIMAPHGGVIEPFTSEISEWIAGEDFSLYLFEGIRNHHVKDLHITSHHFDEPLALKALNQADLVLTVHGLLNTVDEFVMVGGLDLELCKKIESALTEAGFTIRKSEAKYSGKHPNNICNRGIKKKGVQLEITYALRKHLFGDETYRSRFINALRLVFFDELGSPHLWQYLRQSHLKKD